MRFPILHSLLVLVLGSSPHAFAEDWPAFRGPTYQGTSLETNLPLTWSVGENVVWKTVIPGEGWSSPIIWGDLVFLTTATDGGTRCHVLALQRQTGTVRWDREVFQQVPGHRQERNSYASPTPCTDGQRVYACFGDGSFVAVDFQGQTVWTNRAFPFYGEHGLATSAILHDDLLIMARDGSSSGEDKYLGGRSPGVKTSCWPWIKTPGNCAGARNADSRASPIASRESGPPRTARRKSSVRPAMYCRGSTRGPGN